MLFILTVEPKGFHSEYLHCVKRLFDPLFFAPPLIQMFTSYLLIRQTKPLALLHMLSLVCIAREVFFSFLGRVHLISTGPISTVQTEVRGHASF
ncbi:unnamed protein product [Staurois parvus]|uniref:Uncharacterized protein n=1 Tax=Staurois parvus TaxID=386267 RepID=A0ABN9AAB5_9NEOB|nr:unnamed protein product [Staurois parvus]